MAFAGSSNGCQSLDLKFDVCQTFVRGSSEVQETFVRRSMFVRRSSDVRQTFERCSSDVCLTLVSFIL